MLSYKDIGQGTPIIFIHGLGSRKEAWAHQESLADSFRLISVDLRGHGETSLKHDITVKNFALDIVELIEYLNLEPAYICGLSLGGIVAQELHVQRPDLIKGLILANTTFHIPSIYTHGMIHEADRAFKDGSLIDKIVKRGLVNKAYEDDVRKAFYIRDSYMESAKSAIGLNYFFHLFSIRKPVLLIGSMMDQVIPVFNVSVMQNCILNAKSVIFNNTGHLSNIEQAEKFNRAVEEFVSTNTHKS